MAPIYAATLPANTNTKGQLIWTDSSIVDWVDGPTPVPPPPRSLPR